MYSREVIFLIVSCLYQIGTNAIPWLAQIPPPPLDGVDLPITTTTSNYSDVSSSSTISSSMSFKLEFDRFLQKFGSILGLSWRSSDQLSEMVQPKLPSSFHTNSSTGLSDQIGDDSNRSRLAYLQDSYNAFHSGLNSSENLNQSLLFLQMTRTNQPGKLFVRQPQSAIFPTIMMVICVFIVLVCCLANNGRSGLAGDYFFSSPVASTVAPSAWPTTTNPPDTRHIFSRSIFSPPPSQPHPHQPPTSATTTAPHSLYSTNNNATTGIRDNHSQYYPSYYLISFSSVPIHELAPLVSTTNNTNQYHYQQQQMSPPTHYNSTNRQLLALTAAPSGS